MKQRSHHPVNPRFLQFVSKLIEMRGTGFDQTFAGSPVLFKADRSAAIAGQAVFPNQFMAQCVYQPRLTAGVLPEFRENRLIEALPRCCTVLFKQPPDFGCAEVPKP